MAQAPSGQSPALRSHGGYKMYAFKARGSLLIPIALIAGTAVTAGPPPLSVYDIVSMRRITDVRISDDGSRVAFAVEEPNDSQHSREPPQPRSRPGPSAGEWSDVLRRRASILRQSFLRTDRACPSFPLLRARRPGYGSPSAQYFRHQAHMSGPPMESRSPISDLFRAYGKIQSLLRL